MEKADPNASETHDNLVSKFISLLMGSREP